jgi:predicted component of viral defense system (DUF524 family)
MILDTSLDLRDSDGREVGAFYISCLHGRDQWNGTDALVDLRDTDIDPFPAAPVQLLEEMAYAYEVRPPSGQEVDRVEPAELMTFTRTPSSGRIDVQRATGTLTIMVCFISGEVGYCDLEVRSRKLTYETDYRSMLLRISSEAAELVQSAFAPSALPAFRPELLRDPGTTYQRFAFMKALIESEDVRDAFYAINKRPHLEHVRIEERVDPARATRGGPFLARELTRPGSRQPSAHAIAGLPTIPRQITQLSTETTYDTVPNRFVKYVLTRWRDLAFDVERSISGSSPSDQRGRREAEAVVEQVEMWLTSTAVAEAGDLTAFPHSNQVLQGRSGYRQILDAFLLAEAATSITWDDRDRLFKAGQRDVAALYEYWVFLELVRAIELLPGFIVEKRQLVSRSDDGLSLELKRTGTPVVLASGVRRGTSISVKLWFNRNFEGRGEPTDPSWTVTMRPDCSIQIAPENRILEADTWLHFDAKYRVRRISQGFEEATDGPAASSRSADDKPIPTDLQKMHAYRDGIRRTAGAYVLYPGSDDAREVRLQEYHEILPGLGAFALRPTEDGRSSAPTSAALISFLNDVIDHVAAQGTDAERSRYWTGVSYGQSLGRRVDYDSALTRPPADTRVLLGYVRSQEHLSWALQSRRYNLRADLDRAGAVGVEAPELSPDFVLLYGLSDDALLMRTTGAVSVHSAADLKLSGYPDPRGSRYFCLDVELVRSLPASFADAARAMARQNRDRSLWAAPLIVSWLDLVSLIGEVRPE